jgi:transcriptional regulator with XRE-family HTH domain
MMMNVTSDCLVVAGSTPQVITWPKDQTGQSTTNTDVPTASQTPPTQSPVAQPTAMPMRIRHPLHRLLEVRQREGITRRAMARRLGISIRRLEEQESANDVMLSDLHEWQKALGVPLCELVNDPEGSLASPIEWRAKLLLVMKTVRSIQEKTRQTPIRRLAETLATQLQEMMPELKEVMAWPTVGHQRKKRDLGQAFFRGIAMNAFDTPEGPEE